MPMIGPVADMPCIQELFHGSTTLTTAMMASGATDSKVGQHNEQRLKTYKADLRSRSGHGRPHLMSRLLLDLKE
jgi:hypothetical protein